MWLHVPGMSSPSAPASEGLSSASESPVPMLARSVTWRGKLLQPRGWLRVCRMEAFTRRLFGLTLPPSTMNHGADLWIASLAATRASQTASPGRVLASRMTDGCSTKSFTSSVSFGLRLSSVRTCRGTQTASFQPSSRHWKEWATALRLEYSQRTRQARTIDESGYSSWPTARTSDTNGSGSHGSGGLDLRPKVETWPTMRANDAEKRGSTANDPRNGLVNVAHWATPRATDGEKGGPNQSFGAGGIPLAAQTSQWETPSVAVTDGSRLTRGGDRSSEMLLTGQAVQVSAWPTPAARDFKGVDRTDVDRLNARPLNEMVSKWPTPTALDRPRSPETMAKSAAFRKANANQNTVPLYLGEVAQGFSLPPLQTTPYGQRSSDHRRISLRLYLTLMSPKPLSFSRLRKWATRVTRKKLNPDFVEWMHGWPSGWTDLEQEVTGLQAWLLQSRIELLRLTSPVDDGRLF